MHVQELRLQGHVIATAGDSVNDAPALAQANVEIMMDAGTDVAMSSVRVLRAKGDLRDIVRTLALSLATMNNIRQNLFFAFAYNRRNSCLRERAVSVAGYSAIASTSTRI